MLSTNNNNNVESFKAMIWSSKPWNNINDVVINIIGKVNKIFDFKKSLIEQLNIDFRNKGNKGIIWTLNPWIMQLDVNATSWGIRYSIQHLNLG